MISLFSDASSATVITKHTISENVIDFDFGTDGSGYDKLIINEDKHKNNYLSMSGADIFLFTLDVIPNSINKILSRNKLKISDIDHFFFHQASKLVLDNLIRNLNIVDQTKVYSNINIYGNTVSSSIPILLKDAMSKNLLKKGDRILLSGFGVGLSWGSLIIQW
jgi:3-oxoacyl-[acyl-carrier-protein] synthase-3